MGICPFVPLFNSILCADLPRISHYLDCQKVNDKLGKSIYVSIQISSRKEIWVNFVCSPLVPF